MNRNTIGELCKLYSGGTPSTTRSDYWNGNLPWLSSSVSNSDFIYNSSIKITNKGAIESTTKLANKNSVLIATAGEGKTRGQVSFLEIDAYINQSLIAINPNINKITHLYLYYYLKNSYRRLRNLSDATGVRGSLSGDLLKTFSIEYPTIEKQNKITNLLRILDSKIENNNKIIAELESMAKTIYNYWFLQFDFPDEKGKPYKSSGGKMIYNEELKREIPKGWSVKGVLELATWKGNSQPPKSSFIYKHKEGYIRFIQNRDYSGYTINTYIPQNHSYETCDVYDIMMDKYGDAGKTRYGLAGAYNVALAKIVPNDEKFREYLRAFLSSESTYNYLNSSSMASTRASLNENNVSYLSIVIPDDFILQKFTKMAFLNIQKILESKRENQELASLRDFLLPMLMNGQVTFKS